MREYDAVVIGSGAGTIIADAAVQKGLKVALIDKGPLGGTCLNVGCIPSKMLIYPADVIAQIHDAGKLGIDAEIKGIDFPAIMKRMRKTVSEGEAHIRRGLENSKGLDFYETEAHFTGDYTLDVGGEKFKGRKIFIASGARPFIPPIKGLDKTGYLTNETVLKLTEKPESMVIIGGGYIAVEYGHFFAAMGTKVTILQRGERLVPNEEPEISDLLKEKMQKRMDIFTNAEVIEVKQGESGVTVTTKEKDFIAEKIMIAAGRKSNADLLKVEKTGVAVDKNGYITTNEFLETTKKDIYAVGDANGRAMFRHVANAEAGLAWQNSQNEKKIKMDYSAIPYAIFTCPQIAAVGMGEEEAKKGREILVGYARYSEVAKGQAMMEEESFAKAIVEKKGGKILGFHIIGPHAPILIQEVTNAMANGQDIYAIARSIHIHPALPELILTALGNLQEPHEHHQEN